MEENAVQIRRVSGNFRKIQGTNGCRTQRYNVCKDMTAVVAGRMSFIAIRPMGHIGKNAMVFRGLVKVYVECPCRPVSDDADYEPGHEKSFEHM